MVSWVDIFREEVDFTPMDNTCGLFGCGVRDEAHNDPRLKVGDHRYLLL
jgi:hypothetical protein